LAAALAGIKAHNFFKFLSNACKSTGLSVAMPHLPLAPDLSFRLFAAFPLLSLPHAYPFFCFYSSFPNPIGHFMLLQSNSQKIFPFSFEIMPFKISHLHQTR
jgi:hypothetical protein